MANNLASLGVLAIRRCYRSADLKMRTIPDLKNDFGGDVIPGMIRRGLDVLLAFDGYWKDVGTVARFRSQYGPVKRISRD